MLPDRSVRRFNGRVHASVHPMDIALRRPLRLDEFLEWERRQELRYEFDGTQPVAMLSRDFYSGIEFADARLD